MISRLFRIIEDFADPKDSIPTLAFLSAKEEQSQTHPTTEDPQTVPVPNNNNLWQRASHQPAENELDNENNREKAGYPRSRLELLKLAHGGLNFHHGIARLWSYLNKFYPGHRIPKDAIADFVQHCPICQKNRLHMTENNTLEPIVRSPFQENAQLLCTDFLYLGQATSNNNKGVYVFVDYYTKHVAVYPTPGPTAYNLAQSLFTHVARYGYRNTLISDQGSDYVSEATDQLLKWLGMEHTFALVDVHTSNSTERTNRELLRHIRTLLQDNPIVLKEAGQEHSLEWDAPVFLAALHIVLNSSTSTETGYSPNELVFGPESAKNYSFLTPGTNFNATKFLKELGAAFATLRNKSNTNMANKAAERKEKTSRILQNKFQPGDLVLKQLNKPLDLKLGPPFQGPFKVIQQTANDVETENLITGEKRNFPVHVLKIFFGDEIAARDAAKLDTQQHDVVQILAARGNPAKRTSMEFEIEFADGDIRWLPYSKDIDQTTHFETFCRSRHDLWPLLYTTTVLKDELKRLRKPITLFSVFPTLIYIDLRAFGDSTWYENLPLPNAYRTIFVYECQVSNFADPHTQKQVRLFYPLLELTENVDNLWLHSWGRYTSLQPPMQLIDAKFASTYPQILEPRSRSRLLRKFKALL